MNTEAERLYAIADELATTNRRVIQRDAAGQITGLLDVPTNVPRLLAEGTDVMQRAWSHQPPSVDEQGRYQQLDAMRRFCIAAVDHAPETAPVMRERFRQITNTIRLHYDDPAA